MSSNNREIKTSPFEDADWQTVQDEADTQPFDAEATLALLDKLEAEDLDQTTRAGIESIIRPTEVRTDNTCIEVTCDTETLTRVRNLAVSEGIDDRLGPTPFKITFAKMAHLLKALKVENILDPDSIRSLITLPEAQIRHSLIQSGQNHETISHIVEFRAHCIMMVIAGQELQVPRVDS